MKTLKNFETFREYANYLEDCLLGVARNELNQMEIVLAVIRYLDTCQQAELLKGIENQYGLNFDK